MAAESGTDFKVAIRVDQNKRKAMVSKYTNNRKEREDNYENKDQTNPECCAGA